ncbi:hypothetical protein A3Q56_01930 [Intoshia linei]|uniref:FH2 domain-containing protein n=1 Tax=Intoshia linei TaxID=1819745 RepID=A0A177B7Q3_9BILA|nr:hypothetical protein A3Q56_01930 [Intoshia linei]
MNKKIKIEKLEEKFTALNLNLKNIPKSQKEEFTRLFQFYAHNTSPNSKLISKYIKHVNAIFTCTKSKNLKVKLLELNCQILNFCQTQIENFDEFECNENFSTISKKFKQIETDVMEKKTKKFDNLLVEKIVDEKENVEVSSSILGDDESFDLDKNNLDKINYKFDLKDSSSYINSTKFNTFDSAIVDGEFSIIDQVNEKLANLMSDNKLDKDSKNLKFNLNLNKCDEFRNENASLGKSSKSSIFPSGAPAVAPPSVIPPAPCLPPPISAPPCAPSCGPPPIGAPKIGLKKTALIEKDLFLHQKTPKPSTDLRRIHWKKISTSHIVKGTGKNFWNSLPQKQLFINFSSIDNQFCTIKRSNRKERSKSLIIPKKIQVFDCTRKLMVKNFLKLGNQDSILNMIKSSNLDLDETKIKALYHILPSKKEIENLSLCDKKFIDPEEMFILLLSQIDDYNLIISMDYFKSQILSVYEQNITEINRVIYATNHVMHSERLQQLMTVILMIGNYLNSSNNNGKAAGICFFSIERLFGFHSNDKSTNLVTQIAKISLDNNFDVMGLYAEFQYLEKMEKCVIDELKKNFDSCQNDLDVFYSGMLSTAKHKSVKKKFSEILCDKKQKSLVIQEKNDIIQMKQTQLMTFLCIEREFDLFYFFKVLWSICKTFATSAKKIYQEQQLYKLNQERKFSTLENSKSVIKICYPDQIKPECENVNLKVELNLPSHKKNSNLTNFFNNLKKLGIRKYMNELKVLFKMDPIDSGVGYINCVKPKRKFNLRKNENNKMNTDNEHKIEKRNEKTVSINCNELETLTTKNEEIEQFNKIVNSKELNSTFSIKSKEFNYGMINYENELQQIELDGEHEKMKCKSLKEKPDFCELPSDMDHDSGILEDRCFSLKTLNEKLCASSDSFTEFKVGNLNELTNSQVTLYENVYENLKIKNNNQNETSDNINKLDNVIKENIYENYLQIGKVNELNGCIFHSATSKSKNSDIAENIATVNKKECYEPVKNISHDSNVLKENVEYESANVSKTKDVILESAELEVSMESVHESENDCKDTDKDLKFDKGSSCAIKMTPTGQIPNKISNVNKKRLIENKMSRLATTDTIKKPPTKTLLKKQISSREKPKATNLNKKLVTHEKRFGIVKKPEQYSPNANLTKNTNYNIVVKKKPACYLVNSKHDKSNVDAKKAVTVKKITGVKMNSNKKIEKTLTETNVKIKSTKTLLSTRKPFVSMTRSQIDKNGTIKTGDKKVGSRLEKSLSTKPLKPKLKTSVDSTEKVKIKLVSNMNIKKPKPLDQNVTIKRKTINNQELKLNQAKISENSKNRITSRALRNNQPTIKTTKPRLEKPATKPRIVSSINTNIPSTKSIKTNLVTTKSIKSTIIKPR